MNRLLISVSLLLSLTWAGASWAETGVADVVQCMRDNFPETVSIRKIQLKTTNAAGTESRLVGRIYAHLEEQAEGPSRMRATLIIEQPTYLYGAAYLVIETDDYLRDGMFVYMPSVGRVRRISGQFADGPMMGTTFSYFEFKQISNAFGDLQGKYIDLATVSDRPAHVIEFKPVDGLATRYTRVRAWVDQATCQISKAEFYAGNKLLKRLTSSADSLSQSGEQWYFSEVRMHDIPNDAHTVMTIDRVTTNEELSRYRFNPKTFYETR